MKVGYLMLFLMFFALGVLLLGVIAQEIYMHTIGGHGDSSSKSVVEGFLFAGISAMFLKWSRDFWKKARGHA